MRISVVDPFPGILAGAYQILGERHQVEVITDLVGALGYLVRHPPDLALVPVEAIGPGGVHLDGARLARVLSSFHPRLKGRVLRYAPRPGVDAALCYDPFAPEPDPDFAGRVLAAIGVLQ